MTRQSPAAIAPLDDPLALKAHTTGSTDALHPHDCVATAPLLEPMNGKNDQPPQTGHLVAAAQFQDEDNIEEQLIEEGLKETEHNSRMVAENTTKESGRTEV